MNSVWQQVTLSTLPLREWRQVSYVYRLVGSLQTWRQQSWLMQQGDAIAALLISLVFAVSPFVATDLIGWLLATCILFWFLLTVSDDDSRAGFTPIHLLVLLFWGISATAAALSPLKRFAFVGLGKLSLYLMFFILMARVLRSPKLRSFCITAFLLVALVVSSYGIRQAIFGADALATWVDPESPTAQSTRVYSYLGNPNLLAGYLMPAVWLSFSAILVWKRWLPKVLAIVMFGINTACLLLTQSRGGWIGLVVSALVLIVLLRYWWSAYLPRFLRLWALPMVFGGLAGIVVLGFIFVTPFRYRVGSIFAGSGDSSNAFRLNVWRSVIDMIRDRPILGFGPGDLVFKRMYPLYSQARFSALSAYSVLLEIAVESGLIGLTAFLWLLVVTFNQGFVQLRRVRALGDRDGFWLIGAITAMAGMLGHGTVDTVWYRPEVSVLWWLNVALIASYYVPQAEEKLHTPTPELAADS
ncbi:MAG: IctB family putative bicarbonate transporter [Plectolyngbya sp. WJT66-NPBG17]|jgi:putative inorganic carbon (HCO3(-)) transporter|nr:IctB family putative bicarbonate transporter [Plectolyngbya sp. WJT66-NPBG17]